MTDQPITTVEQAVAVLNEKQWRGRNNWRDDLSTFYTFLEYDGIIAIANSLLFAERCAELEAKLAALTVQHAKLTAIVVGVETERDVYRLALAKATGSTTPPACVASDSEPQP